MLIVKYAIKHLKDVKSRGGTSFASVGSCGWHGMATSTFFWLTCSSKIAVSSMISALTGKDQNGEDSMVCSLDMIQRKLFGSV